MKHIFTAVAVIGCLLLCGCEGGTDSSQATESTTAVTTTTVTDTSAESDSDTADRDESAATKATDSLSENGKRESTDSITVSETTAAETAGTADTSEETADLSDDYEDILRAFYDATNSDDYEALIKTTYPAKIVEGMLGIIALDPDAFDDETEGSGSTYEITDIIEEGPMTQEELDANILNLNNIAGGLDILREHGGDPEALSDEEREKVADAIMGIGNPDAADIPDYYSSSKGYDVTVRYNKDEKPDEDYFFVFYVDGEGWKVNNSMRKFVKKAKNVSLNIAAKNVFNAFNCALIDSESDGMTLSGLFIIGSDDSMNCNVPSSVNTAEILKKAENYFDRIADYDYFIIVDNGACIYSAADKKDDNDAIGTYPIDHIPVSLATVDGRKTETIDTVSLDSYSFEELFEVAKKAIN